MIERNKARITSIILILLITGYNCLNTENTKDIVKDSNSSMNNQNMVISEQKETEQEENVGKIDKGNLSIPIDYDFLEENYGVYVENICTNPQSIFKNSVVLSLVKDALDGE